MDTLSRWGEMAADQFGGQMAGQMLEPHNKLGKEAHHDA